MNVRSVLPLALILGLYAFAQWTSPAMAANVYFADDFEAYADDTALGASWSIADVGGVTEVGTTWTVMNPGGRINPPTLNGTASTGNFIISDSDAGSDANPIDGGASHNITSPSFSTAGGTSVWLHADVSAQLNNNGTAIFDVEVSTDGGSTWGNTFSRVAPGRADQGATTRLPDTTNADGYYGRLDVDLTSVALDQGDVRVRLRHYEPNDDWWVAVDNFQIDDMAPPMGGSQTVFAEDFSSGTLGQMLVDGLDTGDLTWNTNDVGGGGRYEAGVVGLFDGHGVNRLMHPDARGQDNTVQFAIIDTDSFGQAVDDYLMTPVLDLSGAAEVYLHFESEGAPPDDAMRILLMRDNDANGPGAADEVVQVLFDYKAGLHDTNEEPFYADRVLSVDGAAGQSDLFFAWHWKGENDWWWAVDSIQVTANPIPEPTSLILLACGLLGLLAVRRR